MNSNRKKMQQSDPNMDLSVEIQQSPRQLGSKHELFNGQDSVFQDIEAVLSDYVSKTKQVNENA